MNQRELYCKASLSALVMALSFSHAQFQVGPTQVVPESRYASTATGTVFNDANRSSGRDPSELGVEGVLVSNGKEVTKTDAEGRYRLPVEDGTVLFITKPSGYAVPVNDEQLPQFYYIHQPEGSPEELGLEFPGIAPTGPLPPAVDFPLIKQNRSNNFKVTAFADPQPRDHRELSYVRDDIFSNLVGTDAVFGVALGDLMFDDLSLFPRYNRLVAQLGVPFYNVPGNHDMNYAAPDDRHSLETFKHFYGPAYYSFDYGQVHFVVLDNVEYLGGYSYRGRLGDDQLSWLDNDLSLVPKDKLIVLLSHIPLKTSQGDDDGVNTVDRQALFKVLAGREHLLALSGHMHSVTEQLFFTEADGFTGPAPFHHYILATASGSWWAGPADLRGIPTTTMHDGTPNGYYLLEFRGNRYTVRFRAASAPESYQLRVMLERGGTLVKETSRAQLGATKLVVNVFTGHERTAVTARFGAGQEVRLAHTRQLDPFMVDLHARFPDTAPEPVPSPHVWQGALPGSLESGAHTLTLRVRDPLGNSFETSQILEISP